MRATALNAAILTIWSPRWVVADHIARSPGSKGLPLSSAEDDRVRRADEAGFAAGNCARVARVRRGAMATSAVLAQRSGGSVAVTANPVWLAKDRSAGGGHQPFSVGRVDRG